MMEVFFYQAECGDAARIRFEGNDGTIHNIMMDSGYERTFRHILYNEIISIGNAGEWIDLWIISHIHEDHLGGAKKYIASIKSGELADIVCAWYYNSPRGITLKEPSGVNSPVSNASSIDSGDYIYRYLLFKDKAMSIDITNEYPSQNFYGLSYKILSPSKNSLLRLREKYESHPFLPLERKEEESVSIAVRTRGYDYQTKLEDFNFDNWVQDNSIENGSSISVLTEYNEKRVLWLADSLPCDVVDSLVKLGYSTSNKLHCDWVKVAHHGSRGNNSNELYDLIECENYVLSVNGENTFYLPTKESLFRIICNKNRRPDSNYNFYFTYDNPTLRSIFDVDGEDVFQKWKFQISYLNEGKFLKVIL